MKMGRRADLSFASGVCGSSHQLQTQANRSPAAPPNLHARLGTAGQVAEDEEQLRVVRVRHRGEVALLAGDAEHDPPWGGHVVEVAEHVGHPQGAWRLEGLEPAGEVGCGVAVSVFG